MSVVSDANLMNDFLFENPFQRFSSDTAESTICILSFLLLRMNSYSHETKILLNLDFNDTSILEPQETFRYIDKPSFI